MTELFRLARALRSGCEDPRVRFAHRLRVGIAVAVLILILSFLE
ncbi:MULTISPECIES: hypothetical protein [Roseobacteraceae]|jgi:hypothetical protein|uniref:Uncharacterized protein n=2 Tax=Roseobacteraceae TaxID=2854170 RepID=A0A239JUX7_9RHOB|nr:MULTISPECIES: hypothetical protein [Roseobacteraceae]SLN78057.1 hypothetical protein ROA7023_04711 [Roseisalinus antarcticus]SNT09519.1 hypothetical protein SAMN04488078_10577 [Antarctobacter heliothermus]